MSFNYAKAIESCAPGASRTIFDGPGQVIDGIDPASIKLLSDRCLILDLPQDDETRNGIVIPEVSREGGVGKGGLFRIGLVIATGPGDKYLEHGLDGQGQVRRTLITQECPQCRGAGVVRLEHAYGDGSTYWGETVKCAKAYDEDTGCDNSGRIPVVVPPQCKPGDKIIYDRRRHEEIIINGQRYSMAHSEQAVIAVLED